METGRKFISLMCVVALCSALLFSAGCETKAQTGALSGAGVGALVGGLANMHGSWGAGALIGAGVGAGLGYLIGNEMDKKDVQQRQGQAVQEGEIKPLAGTTWQVTSIVPKPPKPFKSMISSFRQDGTVLTTVTHMDGKVETATESYRIVGSTLIINKPDYVINSKFRMDGDTLILDNGSSSIVMQRVGG
jgi:hypothetical protein